MRNIPFGKPILGEPEFDAVNQVLRGDVLVHGPMAKNFEKVFAEYTKAPYATSVASCTAGLHLAYFHLKIKEGDEVIVPAQSHVATVHAVELCGGKPVFVDAEEKTGNIDIAQIESKISSRTKAISVVHYLGMPVDMPKVCDIAKKHDLFIIEDCALAVGTYIDGVHAGLFGDLGAFSFYPVKHITTAEGGMVITKHKNLYDSLVLKKAFGVDRTPSERVVPGVYDVVDLGFNYRMNEVEAALGIEQMKRLPGFLQARERNYRALEARLKEIPEISLFESSSSRLRSSLYCLSFLLNKNLGKKRTEMLQYLKEHGVGCSVYYPKSIPEFTYYREKYGYRDGAFPIAARISDTSIALPVGPHLNEEDMAYIAETVKAGIKHLSKN